MIYPFGIVMESCRAAHEFLYQLYLASPLCIAVLLQQPRVLDPPSTEHPERRRRRSCRPTCSSAAPSSIVLGLLFLWFAQVTFSRLEGRFAEKL